MGITKLAHLIHFDAPTSMRNKEIGDYSGKIIAVDTSIVVNRFRSALPGHLKLSPLTGLFYRTLAFLENDIKPVFVLDGKPPNQKRPVLEKRALITGWDSSQSTNSGTGFNHEYHHLLQLIGVPCINAPGEAEALCAHLVKTGIANAVASEDMDTLAFGGTVLLRQLNAKRDSEVTEYSLPRLLEALQLTYKEFVDLCILLGCDYCDKIGGLGPSRALKLIKEHHTIEAVIEHVNRKFEDARKLFLETPKIDMPVLSWNEPDEDGLVHFLCKERHLKEDRVRGRMKRFRESRLKKRQQREANGIMGQARQSLLEDFFPATRKRKAEAAAVNRTIGKKIHKPHTSV